MQRPSTSRGASAQRVKAGGSNRELFTPLRVEAHGRARTQNGSGRNRTAEREGRNANSKADGENKLRQQNKGCCGRRLPSSLARGGGGSGHASGSAMSVRRSSFLNRMAMGRSAAKGGEKTKDTRPLHDKIYFQKSTKQLCEFLLEQDFESQLINPRKLQNPTTRDVLQIFSFLYQMIEPHYRLPDKYEEEIPRLLKDLQYPFPLTKSSMYTIAAPHTWPQVLGALTWLMETVKLYQRCCTNMSLYGNDESAGIFDKEEKREQKCTELFNNYVDMTYKQFLQGADDGGAAKRDLSRQIKGVHEMDELLVHELEREKHQIEEDLANIENMKAEAPEKLKALHQDLQQWLQKQENLQKYISEMESHKSSLRQRLDTVESTILETDLEHQKETALVDHIKIQLEAQTLPPCKVEKLKQQLKDLETAEVELTRAVEENDFQFSLEEKAATRSEVRQKLKRYQEIAHYVGFLPSDSQVPNVDLEFNFRDVEENMGTIDFEAKLKPALLKMKDTQQESINRLSSQLQDQKFNLRKFEPLLAENHLKLEKQEMTLKRLGAEIYLAQQDSAEEERRCVAVEQELKERLWSKRKDLGVEKNEAQEKATASKTRLCDMVDKGPQIRMNKQNQLIGGMDMVIRHFQFVQDEIEALKSQAKS